MNAEGGPRWPSGVTKGPLRFAGYLAFRDPRLLMDYVRWFVGSRRRGDDEAPFQYTGSPISPERARELVIQQLGEYPEGAALKTTRAAALGGSTLGNELRSMAGDISLGELLYVVVRGLRPEIIIETGVAQGITSAYILAALSDNEHGRLHSIDLPSRSMIRSGIVGVAVPPALRTRWTYHWGSSRRLLPRLLSSSGPQLGLFVHDSDHSYANMLQELQRVSASAGESTWIVADDVQLHSAFQDFVRSTGVDAVYVSQGAKAAWTGLLLRPRSPS